MSGGFQQSKAKDSNGNILGMTWPQINSIQNAVLLEDFLVTASAVGGPFCRCSIPGLGSVDNGDIPAPLPLVYVPFMALGFNLKKGANVLIQYDDDDPRYPYLWQTWPIDSTLKPFPIPTQNSPQPASGSNPNLTFPSASTDDYAFNILGNNLIVASNDGYTCTVFIDPASGNTQAYYYSPAGMILFSPQGSVGIQAATKFDIAVGPNLYEFKSDGTFTVTSPSYVSGPLLKMDASGNLLVAGEVTANANLVPTHLSTHKHPSAPTGPPSPPIPGT